MRLQLEPTMSSRTLHLKRFRPALEPVEGRLCLSGMAQVAEHHALHHKTAHHAPVISHQDHATPHRAHHAPVVPPHHQGRVGVPFLFMPGPAAVSQEAAATAQSPAPTVVATPELPTLPTPVVLAGSIPATVAPVPMPVPIAPPAVVPPPAPVVMTQAPVVVPLPIPVPVTPTPSLVVATPDPPPLVVIVPPLPVAPQVPSAALNASVLAYAQASIGTQVANGQCAMLALRALQATGAKTNFDFSNPDGDYAWGQLAATLTPQSHDLSQVQPGDIIQFRDAMFVAPNGYWESATHHTAIVEAVSGDRIEVLQSNINEVLLVQTGDYKLGDMTQGTMWVYHPLSA